MLGPSPKIDTVFQDETIWLTQAQIAELFDVNVPAISKHLTNIYKEGELQKKETISKMETVQQEGNRQVTRNKDFYNLDLIIAVGYRVNSKRATQFRIWATAILKEYIIKGFAMDDERLQQVDKWDYFDEWLERIRDIRTSKKRFYQKIKDIYTTAIDYDKNSEQAQIFFKKVQNKMLWATTGKTAAELIEARSNADKTNMGLTVWRGSIVRKQDVAITNNYLKEDEIKDLNEIVTMYLDYAERQARKRQTVTMEQWADKLRERNVCKITDGRIQVGGGRKKPLIADYILVYKGIKLAVVEAKSDELEVGEGVAQAKLYAQKLNLETTYATNGKAIYQICLKTGHEKLVDDFLSPQALWDKVIDNGKLKVENENYSHFKNWFEKFMAIPFEDKSGTWQLRYYQEIAVKNTLEAIA